MNDRKIIQIAITDTRRFCLCALCDDGTVWINENPFASGSFWQEVAEIPEDSEEELEV